MRESGKRSAVLPARGFTLIEILVGLTLFTLISIGVYSAFRLGAKSWEAGEARATGTAEMRLAAEFLQRQLSGAVPLSVVERRERRVRFEGDASHVVFLTEMTAPSGLMGLYEIALALKGLDEDRRLVVTRRVYGSDVISDAGTRQESVLIEGVERLSFSYYGKLGKDGPRGWHARWEKAPALPELLRIEVTTVVDGPWPTLLVPLFTSDANIRDRTDESFGSELEEARVEGRSSTSARNVAAGA